MTVLPPPASLPTGADWPDAEDYKAWSRIGDDVDDAIIDAALQAVELAIVNLCPTLQTADCPAQVQYAVLLWVNRLMSRRNSPDGIVGVADLGIATIPKTDRDIYQLLGPYREVVLG